MAIKKYTNFEQIDIRVENEGKFLQPEDLFIVSKEESEISEFGDCKYDIMEVSVYDVNNNLLPHKSGKNVSYIKSGDIKNYVYNVTNKGGQKELAIDAERLLSDIGFKNGILKINLNFVRNRVGSDNAYTRVWIQEISPSREEIRILPLKTKDESINNITKKEFENLLKLNKDFKLYKKYILDSLDSFGNEYLSMINDGMVNKFGNEFFKLLKKDFGISSFEDFRNRIFDNFKTSVTYYLTNRYYDIEQSNFGKQLAEKTFEDCERYDYSMISMEVEKILYKCVSKEIKTLKRRKVEYQPLPQEFSVVQLNKSVQDNLSTFEIPITNRRDVYNPELVEIRRGTPSTAITPIPTPIESPVVVIRPIEPDIIPGPPYRPTTPPIVEPDPIQPPISIQYPPLPVIREPEPAPPYIPPTSGGGGSGGNPSTRTPSDGREVRGEDAVGQITQ